jgi:hypothetical protein
MTYLGTAPAFAMAVDTVAAAEVMDQYSPTVAVIGSGLCGAQVPMFAALLKPSIAYVAGLQGMKSYDEVLDFPKEDQDVNYMAIQPRANYGPTLQALRAMVKCPADWSTRGSSDPDWKSHLLRL